MVKSRPANAGDTSSIPGSESSPKLGMATHSSILAWKITCTEDTVGMQSMVTKSQTQMSD